MNSACALLQANGGPDPYRLYTSFARRSSQAGSAKEEDQDGRERARFWGV